MAHWKHKVFIIFSGHYIVMALFQMNRLNCLQINIIA